MPVIDKRSSLLQKVVTYDRKKFFNIAQANANQVSMV
jgi:hypothetical protein